MRFRIPHPSQGGRIRPRAYGLLGLGALFAAVGVAIAAIARPHYIIFLGIGLGMMAVATTLIVLDATYGKRFRR